MNQKNATAKNGPPDSLQYVTMVSRIHRKYNGTVTAPLLRELLKYVDPHKHGQAMWYFASQSRLPIVALFDHFLIDHHLANELKGLAIVNDQEENALPRYWEKPSPECPIQLCPNAAQRKQIENTHPSGSATFGTVWPNALRHPLNSVGIIKPEDVLVFSDKQRKVLELEFAEYDNALRTCAYLIDQTKKQIADSFSFFGMILKRTHPHQAALPKLQEQYRRTQDIHARAQAQLYAGTINRDLEKPFDKIRELILKRYADLHQSIDRIRETL